MLVHRTSWDKKLVGLGDDGCGLNSLGDDANDRWYGWE